jgi:hypothetical protein
MFDLLFDMAAQLPFLSSEADKQQKNLQFRGTVRVIPLMAMSAIRDRNWTRVQLFERNRHLRPYRGKPFSNVESVF